MVFRDNPWPAGTPCWVDLGTDVERAVSFYTGLFGWDIQVGGEEVGGYGQAFLDGKVVAGFGPLQDPSQPTAWTTYLASADLDGDAAKVKGAGGQIVVDPMDIMEFGRMFIAVDPTGAMFGVWEAGTHYGVQLTNEPGSLSWNEHLSGDLEAAKDFYAKVFGYSYDEVGGPLSYVTFSLTEGGDAVGGMGASGVGSWGTYFNVADTDAAAALVEELGGRVIDAPESTPFGRMATVADDQGAIFKLIADVPAR
ncbi:Putative hydroxylase [Alloactinosynnema sp. L-07]|uniref:VOC family protein n=1 Tax=Alloactinosynnema sp. L-07 TaxID=1653480 RepID=UPI00065F091A|nr:VOC family protein [Alloactinosynnema sp. L-07]CRK55891.1 Putative hydroxylase [Alloactinosynnema sp. L-07]